MITKNTCWWCGNQADSREHIFKKSLIKKVYGSRDIKSVMDYNGQRKSIQGPSQNSLKFKANLCQNCNNSRSSAFDKAYDQFLDSIEGKLDYFIKTQKINWIEIYDTNWVKDRKNLLKYFVKHIGCRLNHNGHSITSNISAFLDDKEELKDLKIVLEIRPFNQVLMEASEE